MKRSRRHVIIGGSTGGASISALLRRADPRAEITLIEKSEYVSTAYCGLAYALGGLIANPETLIPLSPDDLSARMRVAVRTREAATAIDRDKQQVHTRNEQGDEDIIPYDKLILSPGAAPVRLGIPGEHLPGVFNLRTIADLHVSLDWLERGNVRKAVVVGGGFIGLEVVENLARRGIKVTLIEARHHVFGRALDQEMAGLVHRELARQGVRLALGCAVTRIDQAADKLVVRTTSISEPCDMLVIAVGTRPVTTLATAAGLDCANGGSIKVNDRMQTSDPNIYAIGDAVQIPSRVRSIPISVQLASPLAQQARVAAANATGQQDAPRYPGALGTFGCKVFDMTVAVTGLSEDILKRHGIAHQSIFLPSTNRVFFYPGSAPLYLKVHYDEEGLILGGQAIGTDGAEKRIDILATAIHGKIQIHELEYLDLVYAPPYGSPRDPVNLVGSVARAQIKDGCLGVSPQELGEAEFADAQIVDLRTPDEFELHTLPGAINIPNTDIMQRSQELDPNRPVVICCNSGATSTSTQRMLKQAGFKVWNLTGGYIAWRLIAEDEQGPDYEELIPPGARMTSPPEDELPSLDLTGLTCPGPFIKAKRVIQQLGPATTIIIKANDMGFRRDISSWCSHSGHEYLGTTELANGAYQVKIRSRAKTPARARAPTVD